MKKLLLSLIVCAAVSVPLNLFAAPGRPATRGKVTVASPQKMGRPGIVRHSPVIRPGSRLVHHPRHHHHHHHHHYRPSRYCFYPYWHISYPYPYHYTYYTQPSTSIYINVNTNVISAGVGVSSGGTLVAPATTVVKPAVVKPAVVKPSVVVASNKEAPRKALLRSPTAGSVSSSQTALAKKQETNQQVLRKIRVTENGVAQHDRLLRP